MWLLETPVNDEDWYPRLVSITERDLEPLDEHYDSWKGATQDESEDEPEDVKSNVPYAILSHRWENEGEEISFDDIMSGRPLREKKGWFKLQACCRQARSDGYQYAWVDTCCIDKRSSAELQEAINSMYHWYARAAVCYVYLRDVAHTNWEAEFSRSEWFKRGWTLQELLAPGTIFFMDKNWTFLGNRSSLKDLIADSTSIEIAVLDRRKLCSSCSVAARMSWASHRQTSRIEDRAYSLLGIFGINMPLLYGEGDRAFLRLQEEIVRRSDDHSIFAWSSSRFARSGTYRRVVKTRGLFAISPEDFQTSGQIYPCDLRGRSEPYEITNKGLSISLPLIPYCPDVYLVPLDCSRDGKLSAGIFLRPLPAEHERDKRGPIKSSAQFERVAVNGCDLFHYPSKSEGNFHTDRQPLLVPQIELRREYEVSSVYGFRVSQRMLQGLELDFILFEGGQWDGDARTISIPHGSRSLAFHAGTYVGFLLTERKQCGFKIIAFAFSNTFRPLIFLSESLDLNCCMEGGFHKHELNLQIRARRRTMDIGLAIQFWSDLLRRDRNPFRPGSYQVLWGNEWVLVRIDRLQGAGQEGMLLHRSNSPKLYFGRLFAHRNVCEVDGKRQACWEVDFEPVSEEQSDSPLSKKAVAILPTQER